MDYGCMHYVLWYAEGDKQHVMEATVPVGLSELHQSLDCGARFEHHRDVDALCPQFPHRVQVVSSTLS